MSITPLRHRNLREFTKLLERTLENGARCRIRAHNDIEAIERWLDEYFDKPTTYRTYKKEAERFLVWCVEAQNINSSSLSIVKTLRDLRTIFLRIPSP